jgi:Flp pilus assembly protein TadD
MSAERGRTADRLVSAGLFLLGWAGCLRTMAPSVYTADNGELITTAFRLGVPHPTGYVIYNNLGNVLMRWLPLANIPFRLSLLSGLCAALSLVAIYALARELLPARWAALSVPLLFGFSSTFWSQGVIGEVYAMHILLIAVLTLLYLRLRHTDKVRTLLAFAFTLGLALSHHLMTGLLAPAFLVLLLRPRDWRLARLWLPFTRRRPRILPLPRLDRGHWRWVRITRLGPALVFLLLPAAQFVYIPLRYTATTIVGWGTLNNWLAIFRHISGRQFHTIMFTFNEFVLARSIEYWRALLLEEFALPVLALAALGAVYLLVRRFWAFLFLALVYLVDVAFAINYMIVDIDVYYIQGYLALAAFAAAGMLCIAHLLQRFLGPTGARARAGRLLVGALPVVLASWTFVENYHPNDRSRNYIIHDYGQNVMSFLEPNSILLTQGWSLPFLFSYMQEVIDMRRDVWGVIDNAGGFLKRLIENRRTRTKPIYSNTPLEIMTERYVTEEPFGLVYRVGDYPYYQGDADRVWKNMRTRGLHDPSVAKDFHNTAVVAMYYYLLGEYYFSKGLPDQALEQFRLASFTARDNEMIRNNLAAILFKHGFLEESEKECRKALELSPRFHPARYNLANIYFQQKRYKLALQEWEKLPQSQYVPYANRAIAAIHMERGEYDLAVQRYEDALRQDPRSAEVLTNLGTAYLRMGRLWPAERTFRKLLNYYPDSPEGHNNLASVLIQKGELAAAEAETRRALELRPDYPDALCNMGILLAQRGDFDGAESRFNKALELDPKHLSALNNLALLRYRQKRFDEAAELWKRSLFFKPEQPHIMRNLEELMKVAGDKGGTAAEGGSPSEEQAAAGAGASPAG